MTLPWHILIYEPDAGGHEMIFVRSLLSRMHLLTREHHVTLLTTGAAAAHPTCRRVLDEFPDLVTLRIAPDVTEGNRFYRALHPFYERQWRQAEMLHRGLAELDHAVDFILLPSLESIGLAQIVARPRLFRGLPWATVANSVTFHHRAVGIETPFRPLDIPQRLLFWRVARDPSLVCFGSVDPYFARWTRRANVAWCPDPCDAPVLSDQAKAREAYGIRDGSLVILVFGFIDRRKCVDVLLRGVALLGEDVDLTVLLAGKQHAGHLAAALDSEAAHTLREKKRLVEVNRFIDFASEIDPMSAADIVWVFYEKDFVRNSNVLSVAGLARRPVIARRQGVVGRLVEQHELGLALDSEAPERVAEALTRLAGDKALRERMGDNGARVFAGNTPENFARPIIDAINAWLERPEASA
jgi:glycosyltransferase involved in cell wall biosynthesis